MAKALGRRELYAILEPEILFPVPRSTLEILETHFHALISNTLAAQSHELAMLRLPDLVVLTELELPVMWFPLKSKEPRKRADHNSQMQKVQKPVRVRPGVLLPILIIVKSY